MLATARPTLTDGIGPGPGRMNNARPADIKPDQAAGIPKAPKLKIKFKGKMFGDKTITEADTGGQKNRKRKHETAGPAAQTVFAKKALSSGMDSFVKPVMAVASDLEAMLGAPHAKLPAPRRASPTARHSARDAAISASMLAAVAESTEKAGEPCPEQPSPGPAGRSAKKQRLLAPAAAQQAAAPAAVSEHTPTAQVERSRAVPAQKSAAPVQEVKMLSAPAQAVAQQLQQQAAQPTPSSAAAAQQQQGHTSIAAPTLSIATEQPTLAQPAQAAPKASQAVPKAHSAAGRDLPVVERARAELRAAVAEREREKAAQQEATRAQANKQASPQHQQQQENASSGPQDQKNVPAQGTAGPQKVPNEEKARWLAKIRSRRPTQEQKEAEEKQRIAEAARREEERQQREAEEKACREAVERIEKLEETLKKYRATGVPEWLQQGVLFEEEERDEWVGVYKLAGRPWPAKYDIPGACCMLDGAGAAAAQPAPAGQPSKPNHETVSRLARSDSDMDIDDPVLPELPKKSLHVASESMLAVAQAAASGQSCGTHNGASPDVVNTSMGPPARLYPSAAAAPQAQACLSAAAAALEANHAAKDCRPSPGSSESETEGVNIPAPKLEEGELAGGRQSAPQKDQRRDAEWDRRESHERRSREYYSHRRYSSERRSREYSPDRTRHDWRERSRSRSRGGERARRHRAAYLDSRSRERDSSERYARSRPSYDRLSHERDSPERRYSERSSRERSPGRSRRDWRERSRSRSRCHDNKRHQRRDDERPRHAVASSSAHEDSAELKAKMEALKASTQHDKRYIEVALAALQRRLVKALMAEHVQKKQSREADRARARPAAASTEAVQEVAPKESAASIPEKPNAAHNAAPPLPQELPPPKLAPLPPVPVMPAAPTCPQAPWPAQASAPAPGGLTACYPPAQQSAAVGVYPAQYGQQWPQQPWGATPAAQYPPGKPQYWP